MRTRQITFSPLGSQNAAHAAYCEELTGNAALLHFTNQKIKSHAMAADDHQIRWTCRFSKQMDGCFFAGFQHFGVTRNFHKTVCAGKTCDRTGTFSGGIRAESILVTYQMDKVKFGTSFVGIQTQRNFCLNISATFRCKTCHFTQNRSNEFTEGKCGRCGESRQNGCRSSI